MKLDSGNLLILLATFIQGVLQYKHAICICAYFCSISLSSSTAYYLIAPIYISKYNRCHFL